MLGNLSPNRAAKNHWVKLALVAGALVLVAVFAQSRVKPTPSSKLRLSFELPDASGKTRRLEEFAEFRLFVHFWATWCPPCVDELPQILEFARRSPKDKVLVVSLDENWEKAHGILPREGLAPNVVALLDASGATANSWGSYQFPETYLLDPGLKLRTKWIGPQDWLSLGAASKVR